MAQAKPVLGVLVSPTVVYELELKETTLGRNDSNDIVRIGSCVPTC